MSQAACRPFAPHLEAFADGELRGDLLRRVSAHLETCAFCRASLEDVTSLGLSLRCGLEDADVPDLSGFADGVVSRVRAEDRESWRGKLERATDDMHWVLVGSGSVAAAFLTILTVSLVLHTSVVQRDDSLAAMLMSMRVPVPELGQATVLPASFDEPVQTPDDGVQFVTKVNNQGHVVSLVPLPGDTMTDAEAQQLVNQLRGLKFSRQIDPGNMTDPDARRFIWLFSTTEVRADENSKHGT